MVAKMMRMGLITAAVILTACTSPEEARRQSLVGEAAGESIYEFKVEHWPTALWADTKLEAWVKREAVKLCPQGYRELSRRRGQQHVYYGSPISMPYNDVHVRISCPAVPAGT